MAGFAGQTRASRITGGALALALQLALAWVVWVGLSARFPHEAVPPALTSLDFTSPPPPKPPPRLAPRHARSQGKAAPANLRAQAAAIVAPKVEVLKPVPVPAATVAGTGAENHAGAAPVAGPGSGAGGVGLGSGSGGDGDGAGSGGVHAELIGGRIKDSDFPQELRGAPFEGTTRVGLTVGVQGRVSACRILRSSGAQALDDLTCRLIIQRFRFRPAQDGQGRLRSEAVAYDQEWSLDGQFDEDKPDR